MRDDELEGRLRQVRPAGPPPELRARIRSRRERAGWPWLAAAALLLLTLTLQFMGAQLRQELRPEVAARGDAETALVSTVRDALGVTEDEARAIAMLYEIRTTIDAKQAAERQP